ncbi:MAG: LysE family translocator [Aestuariivirgaceae bacterium]
MVVDLETLVVFVPVALALALTPGADMLFALGQGIRSGPMTGIAAGLGGATGALCHTLAAGLGLAALLGAYPLAFEVVRWSGVAYLLWLAFQAFRAPPISLNAKTASHSTPVQAWRSGVLVNILNPKVAVFVLALVPQFIEPSRGSVFLQFLVFGSILSFAGAVVNSMVGAFAGKIGAVISQSASAARVLQMATGLIFLGLAVKLAFERR